MATVWEKIQASYKAALEAWRASPTDRVKSLPLDDLRPEERDRAAKYELLWRYYGGQFKRPLKVTPGKPDDNVLINHCRRIVDKGVSFLMGQEVEFQLAEGQKTADEKALDEVWKDNHKMSLLHDVALNGGVCGTYHIQIMPDKERASGVRLVNLYPGMVFPEWNPNDVDDVWVYQLRWRSEDGKVKRTIWTLREDGKTWEFFEEVMSGRGRWVKEGASGIWEYSWCPIISGKNLPNPNNFFGLSDLEDADLNDAVNFVASNMNRITRLYGHPVPWGFGFSQKELSVEPGKAVLTNNEKANLQYLQMTSDMGNSLGLLQRYTTDFYKTARVPEMDPSLMTLGAQSGFALRVLYGDLIEKTTTKQLLYGDALVELNRRILDFRGKGDDKIVTVHWKDPLPPDERSEIAALQFDMQAELCSKETASEKRGYDFETENTRLEEEQQGKLNLGEALLTGFNQGKNLGIPQKAPAQAAPAIPPEAQAPAAMQAAGVGTLSAAAAE